MIQTTPQMRILVAIEPADFRKGIDGLARIVKEEFQKDPFSGCAFVFRNRRATAVKILIYDGRGFWLCQKRMSKGRFRFWPKRSRGPVRNLESHELSVLLTAGNFEAVRSQPIWREVRSGE